MAYDSEQDGQYGSWLYKVYISVGEVEEKVSRDNKSLTKQVVKIIIISIWYS